VPRIAVEIALTWSRDIILRSPESNWWGLLYLTMDAYYCRTAYLLFCLRTGVSMTTVQCPLTPTDIWQIQPCDWQYSSLVQTYVTNMSKRACACFMS